MFTDEQLAIAMRGGLVASGVMTQADQDYLLDGHKTERDVSNRLDAQQQGHFVPEYWPALGTWMAEHDGDIGETTGRNVPGREGGNPTGSGRALYNDAFNDVNEHLVGDFRPVIAISRHLQFVDLYQDG